MKKLQKLAQYLRDSVFRRLEAPRRNYEKTMINNMIKKLEAHLQRDFKSNYVTYWNNLSRLTNMLIISNFSLFFLTELVTRDRYYYTHLSLGFLFIVHVVLILPLGLLDRIWYYRLCLLLEFGSIYFFVVSIWYWVVTNIS
jgi:hypothetical protein